MTQPFFDSEQLAAEWATRICGRLQELNVPEQEVEETRSVIFAFTRIAADELSKDREVKLPYASQPFRVEAAHAHQVIDLFLRGVNMVAKKLRDSGLPWEERREHLERFAWKLFNLSKLLVGFLYVPNPELAVPLNSEKDLHVLLKQSVEALYREQVMGTHGVNLPINMQWTP